MKIAQTINRTPRFRMLSDDQIEQIYFSALDVLEASGGRVFHEEALDLFRNTARPWSATTTGCASRPHWWSGP